MRCRTPCTWALGWAGLIGGVHIGPRTLPGTKAKASGDREHLGLRQSVSLRRSIRRLVRAGRQCEGHVCHLQDVLTVVVDDLRLCSVKPCEDIERRFCFEVVSPTK